MPENQPYTTLLHKKIPRVIHSVLLFLLNCFIFIRNFDAQVLHKEEEKLNKELARVKGMLSNERFVSKAPESKVAEEKAKLEKYTNMMEQVKERLKQLEK